MAVLHQAERRLELAAQCRELWRSLESGRQFDPARREAAAAPQHAAFSIHDADDGIINPVCNRAVVNEGVVGNASKPRAGLAVVDDRGLLRNVAAGHHQGNIHVLQ